MSGAAGRPVRPSPVYWCEVHASCPGTTRSWTLARRLASSPEQALRWLAEQATRLADVLEPVPGPAPAGVARVAGRPSTPPQFLRMWLADRGCQEQQRSSLAAGRAVTLVTGGRDRVCGHGEQDVRYWLSVRPTPVGRPEAPDGGTACGDRPLVAARCGGPARPGAARAVPAARPSVGCGTVAGRWVGQPYPAAPQPAQDAVPR